MLPPTYYKAKLDCHLDILARVNKEVTDNPGRSIQALILDVLADRISDLTARVAELEDKAQ